MDDTVTVAFSKVSVVDVRCFMMLLEDVIRSCNCWMCLA